MITAVNGQTIKDARELARVIGDIAPGTTAKLDVLHQGKRRLSISPWHAAMPRKPKLTPKTMVKRRPTAQTFRASVCRLRRQARLTAQARKALSS